MTDTECEYHAVAKTGDLDDQECIAVSVGRTDIGIYRLDGQYYALSDICTHAYAAMTDGYVEDGQIECPLHGACFDIRTGKALTAPATEDLDSYPVRIEGDQIQVGLPKGTG
jgi:3-phenylpropionate/trans-cinnamate dioxygenase ferredoxin subunit